MGPEQRQSFITFADGTSITRVPEEVVISREDYKFPYFRRIGDVVNFECWVTISLSDASTQAPHLRGRLVLLSLVSSDKGRGDVTSFVGIWIRREVYGEDRLIRQAQEKRQRRSLLFQ